jgi:hypothetical protein
MQERSARTVIGVTANFKRGTIRALRYMMRSAPRGKEASLNGDNPVEQQQSTRTDVEGEVQALLTELAEMAKQISSQLDARAARLEVLIRQADERIERLSAMPKDQRSRFDDDSVHGGTDRAKYAEVHALADEGLAPHEIAQRLDRPKGEIELILALRKQS